MGMLASDVRRDGSLTAAWDGATPATEPSNTCVTVNQPANGCVTFQLTGTWVGTLTFEVSLGATYVAVPATKLGASPAQATTTTTTGIYVVHAPGTVYIRARCSAFTSGTITVIGIGSVTEFIPSAAGLASAGASTVAGSLTNNNAAPGATNIGVLPAIANAAVPSWTEGRQVLLSTDLSGFQRGIIHGTTASAGTAVGVNPVVTGFVGTGATVRAWTASNSVTATAGNDVPGVGPLVYDTSGAVWNRQRDTNSADNSSGTGVAGAGLLAWDGSVYRRVSSNSSGQLAILGTKTNNSAAPGATNAGALVGIANAAAPSWSEGNEVLLSTDLAGNTRVAIGNNAVTVADVTLTRPGNTTLYTAQDEIVDNDTLVKQFTAGRVNAGTGTIEGLTCIYSSNPTVTPQLRVLLFDTAPATAGDNTALALSDTDANKSIGYIDLNVAQAGGSATSANLIFDSGPTAIDFVCAGGSQLLYCLIVTRNGFTPIANSETLKFRFRVRQTS